MVPRALLRALPCAAAGLQARARAGRVRVMGLSLLPRWQRRSRLLLRRAGKRMLPRSPWEGRRWGRSRLDRRARLCGVRTMMRTKTTTTTMMRRVTASTEPASKLTNIFFLFFSSFSFFVSPIYVWRWTVRG